MGLVFLFRGTRLERCQSTSRHGTCRCYAQSARWCTDSSAAGNTNLGEPRLVSKQPAACHQLVLQLSKWHSLPLPTYPKWNKLRCTAWPNQIVQLTLCQFTGEEIETATKLSKKTCQKLTLTTDLDNATRKLHQLMDSCTISASCQVSQAQKALLLLPRTEKGSSTFRQLMLMWGPSLSATSVKLEEKKEKRI